MANSAASSGLSFSGLLAILFIGLKLGKVISWPWLWVLSPLWAPLVIIALFFAIVALVALYKILTKAK